MTPRKDFKNYLDTRQTGEEQERIFMRAYVETVSFLINPNVTNDGISSAAAEIVAFRQRARQTAARFAKTLKDEALKCRELFSEQRAKSSFLKGFYLSVRDDRQTSWAAGPTAHSRHLETYVDTLVQPEDSTSSLSANAAPPKSAGQNGLSNCQQNQGREEFLCTARLGTSHKETSWKPVGNRDEVV